MRTCHRPGRGIGSWSTRQTPSLTRFAALSKGSTPSAEFARETAISFGSSTVPDGESRTTVALLIPTRPIAHAFVGVDVNVSWFASTRGDLRAGRRRKAPARHEAKYYDDQHGLRADAPNEPSRRTDSSPPGLRMAGHPVVNTSDELVATF